MAISFSGGFTTFPLIYNIPIYPFGVILVPVYVLSVSYAIVKYRLMDIRLAITRATIFLFIYAILLVIPLAVGFKYQSWMTATFMMLILATAAPFAYTWARRTVEHKLFAQEGFLERQKSLDMMVGSLMHELNNPLSVASVNAEYLTTRLEHISDDKAKVSAKLLGDSVKRMKNLVRTILEYSRVGTGELQDISLKEVVEEFLIIMRPQFRKEDIDVTLEMPDQEVRILGDKVQLEEILVNFGQNSIHALKSVDNRRVALKLFLKDPRTVRLEFSDNGYGIEPHMLEDIFLPSVTTKPKGEGTGIGLARVKRIIELHKGSIWAESDGKSRGAKFVMELPALKKSADK